MTDRDDAQQNQHAAIRQFLLTPASYSDRPAEVELIETHISCVFLAGDSVYKLKKPVHFEFVDFSTAASRENACREELRLNRRLAADVYLDVLPITRESAGNLALAGSGEAIDWVVHMRRLPIERTLDARLRAGEVTSDEVARLSQLLGEFYARAERAEISPEDYRLTIEQHVRANRADLLTGAAEEHRSTIRRSHAAQLQFLLICPEIFDERVAKGRIIDGHGDLRPEHICLTEPPVVFDCLEFDAALRRLDLADELSFLAMECERVGAVAIGRQVRSACLARCGDDPPVKSLAFYQSYRACVRAKVAALRVAQLPPGVHAAAAKEEVVQYLQIAGSDTRSFARPMLLVTSGMMGSGKSTLAAALAETLGCEVLTTDAVRRELFGASADESAFNTGSYAPQNRQRVYDELFARARTLLTAGQSIVLDGTFLDPDLLLRAAAAAEQAGAHMLAIRCTCPDQVALARIAARHQAGSSLSEARPELYQQQCAELRPIPAEIPQITVDTTTARAAQTGAVINRLRSIIGPAA